MAQGNQVRPAGTEARPQGRAVFTHDTQGDSKMTKSETEQAAKLLADRTDRVETCGADTEGGWCLTAFWRDGGCRLFYSLDQVHQHVESH